jgi:hypothetical protein
VNAAKRNRSTRKVGHKRGVPIRLLRAVARKYDLSHLVAFTMDNDHRSRIIYFAKNDQCAMQCAHVSEAMAKTAGWETVYDWDCSSVQRMKKRITELELGFARVIEHEGDPIRIAREALNLPDDV